MDEAPTDIQGWIAAIIGGCIAIVVLLGPMYLDRYHIGGDGWIGGFVIGNLLVYLLMRWTDTDEEVDHARKFLLFPFGQSSPHSEGITGDE